MTAKQHESIIITDANDDSTTSAPTSLMKTIKGIEVLNSTVDPAYLGDEFNIVIVIVTILLCFGAVTLNLGVLTFYWPKIKQPIPFLYSLLSFSDFITGICAGFHALLFITIVSLKDVGLQSSFWLITVSYFLTVVTFKLSAFMSMIIAVIRTIKIVSPFTQVSKKGVLWAISVWTFVWIALASVDVGLIVETIADSDTKIDSEFVVTGYLYQHSRPKIFDRFSNKNDLGAGCLVDMAYTASPTLLCVGITLVATVIQVIWLLKKGEAECDDPERDYREKKTISITIIMICLLFVLCVSCTLYQPFNLCLSKFAHRRRHYEWLYITGNIPFFLNAALNPLILVSRGTRLRIFIWGILRGRRVPAVDQYGTHPNSGQI